VQAEATLGAIGLERLEEAVSRLTGIVREVVPLMAAADESRLPAWACSLASASRTIGHATVGFSGSAHVSPAHARAASIGEALERYAATFCGREVIVSTANELAPAAVEPTRFALFHERQFATGIPFERFTGSSTLSFVEAVSLQTGEPGLIPAQLVYLGLPREDEPTIGYATSNGLACGQTLEDAILAGLLELVERDAMMIAWNARLSLPRLAWDDDVELLSVERNAFSDTGLRYWVLDGSPFLGIPVALALVEGAAGERATFGVGAASAPTVASAWCKALAEAFSVHRWLRELTHRDGTAIPASRFDVRTFDDHLLFYATPERARQLGFLTSSVEIQPTSEVAPLPGETTAARIDSVVALLADRGIEPYAVDVTSADVAELGVAVARVVAPQLCAIDVYGGAPYLGGDRRYTEPYTTAFVPAPLDFDDMNLLPHPYP
jgi:ribosomal protein S12 methylthiotransferase accessory factor